MIKKIKYVCDSSPDYFTCHALFSRITDGALSKIIVNPHTEQPKYRVYFEDRAIYIILKETEQIRVIDTPEIVEFNHKGNTIKAYFKYIKDYNKTYNYKNGDFINLGGVISYARKSEDRGGKTISPFTTLGKIIPNEKTNLLNFLELRLGVDLKTQVDSRDFRFENISYKNFDSGRKVFSKDNSNKISLQNVFSFEVKGFIKNEVVLNELEITSIGRKRSYGLGNVYIRG